MRAHIFILMRGSPKRNDWTEFYAVSGAILQPCIGGSKEEQPQKDEQQQKNKIGTTQTQKRGKTQKAGKTEKVRPLEPLPHPTIHTRSSVPNIDLSFIYMI